MLDLKLDTFEHLVELAEGVSCISFDFFDTLFFRPIEDPEDAFEILEKEFPYKRFKKRRQTAQVKAFQRMHQLGKKEISLQDIYDCFDEANAAVRTALMQAEYELELKLIEPNPEMFELVRRYLYLQKQVVITSDMYLPVDFFREALRKHGLEEDLPLYISSDKNATKRDRGELFETLMAELRLPADKILHIGDNKMSDVSRALEKQLKAFHYFPKERQSVVGPLTLEKSFSYGLLRTRAEQAGQSPLFRLGFLYGGPASLGFLDWLKTQAVKDEIEHLLFLSRDGYILERLARGQKEFGQIKFHYFLGSRVAFNLAAMTYQNFDEFIPFLLSGSEGLMASELLERIGVHPPANQVMQDLGLGKEISIGPETYPRVSNFLRAYRAEILKTANLNRRALYQYLRQRGIHNGSKVALVDVGWSGTTQEAFERALRNIVDLQVHGYYFCLADTQKRLELSQSQSMNALLSSQSIPSKVIASIHQNRVAIEMMFSAPHHTVIGLRPHELEVKPVFDPGRGSGLDMDEILTVIDEINSGSEFFAKCFGELSDKIAFEKVTSPLEMAQPLIDLAVSKDNEDIDILRKIKSFDAWGSSRNFSLDLDSYRK